jgi:hypothetical protein
MADHERCLEDDCECFADGEYAAWGQVQDLLDDIGQRLDAFKEQYERAKFTRQSRSAISSSLPPSQASRIGPE